MPRAPKTPSLEVQMMETHLVIPYRGNPRKNDAAIAKVAKLIEEFGWQQPIVVDRHNVIIVGDTRFKAGRLLGHRMVPVVVAKHLTAKQAKAYRLADNRAGEEAEWDPKLLAVEVEELRVAAFNLELTAFDPAELGKLRLDDGGEDEQAKERKLSDNLMFQVVVDCKDETDQAALMARLKAEDRKCRPLTL